MSAAKTTGPNPSDRRVRKTRRSIQDALVSLCSERPFGAITVEDIIDRADVARATFYAHYRAKEDVLVAVAHDLATDRAAWMAVHEAEHPEGYTGDLVRVIFEHADQHRDVYAVILNGAGDARALGEFFTQTSLAAQRFFELRAERTEPRLPIDFVARAWAGELVGCLTWWINGSTGYSAEEMARMLTELSRHGRRWAQGA